MKMKEMNENERKQTKKMDDMKPLSSGRYSWAFRSDHKSKNEFEKNKNTMEPFLYHKNISFEKILDVA